jgi:hypothetical protein
MYIDRRTMLAGTVANGGGRRSQRHAYSVGL